MPPDVGGFRIAWLAAGGTESSAGWNWRTEFCPLEVGCSAQLLGSWRFRLHADEVGGVIRAPAPFPACDLGIGAKRPRSAHPPRGLRSALVLGGDDLLGGDAVLDPVFQSSAHVVLRVALGRACTKAVGTRSTSAVLHAWDHEQAHERGAVFGTHFGDHALEVVDGALGRNCRIAPTVVEDELSAAFPETLQIGVRRVQHAAHFVIRGLGIAIYPECPEIPCRIREDHVLEELRPERVHEALLRRGAGDPCTPPAGLSLAAWRITGEDLLAFGASRPGVDLGQRFDLGRRETTVGLRSLAQERGGFEVALHRVFDDTILDRSEEHTSE